MGKLGEYQYPDFQMGTLIKAVEVLVKQLHGESSAVSNFASAIGHKTHNSGAFIAKLADLRRYGLIDKRGIVATERAKNIVDPIKPDEREKALNDAVMEIELWKDLYRRLRDMTVNENEFRIQLSEVTKTTDDARKDSEKIRKLYLDAIAYYNPKVKENDKKPNEHNEEDNQHINPPKINGGINITFGDIHIQMPNDVESAETAKQLIELHIKKIQKK